MHAALGDPTRLAIVDRLTSADAAPGELGRELGIVSNLLAHHLGVLEGAGIVRRSRSEGDARRCYLRLALEDPDVARLAPALQLQTGVRRLVFVCTHNSARSQLAAACWGSVSDVPVTSAGTEPAARVHPRAIRVAGRHGLVLRAKQTRHVDDVLEPGDLVVAVCDNAYEHLAGTAAAPSLHWSVPDPARVDTGAAFEAAYAAIAARVGRLAAAVPAPP